jgi:F0F1-type ATP synthase gamma subunit
MANAREIQARMKSIKDTMKITNAMYMISSSKLQKAEETLKIQSLISTQFKKLLQKYLNFHLMQVISILMKEKMYRSRKENRVIS